MAKKERVTQLICVFAVNINRVIAVTWLSSDVVGFVEGGEKKVDYR